jgi:hypothetical protein
LFGVLLSVLSARGQTDACGASATLLTPGAPGATCSGVAGSTVTGFTDSNQGCTDGAEDDDGWYRFVATATSHTITVDGANNMDAVLGIYNSCGGTQPAGGGCVDAGSDGDNETRTITGLTVGNTYLICVHDYNNGGGDFTICITTPALPPTNDACSSPISLTPGTTCSPTSGSTSLATQSGQGCTLGNEDDDVWYAFVASSTTHTVTVNGAANMDAVLGVYSTCAGSQPTGGTCVDASGSDGNETATLTGLTIGSTYLICIYDYNAGGGDFTICVTQPVTNDLCSGAITATCGNTYTGSTGTATSAGDPSSLCGVTPDANGVWYAFSGTGDNITASLCGSSYDTQINIYSGSCGSLGCVAGNDEYCGSSSQVTFTSTIGVTYYILVNGYNGASGNYSLAITCTVPPPATAADCGAGTTICSNTSFNGNSGGGGNITDFTNANTDCLDAPEHQTSWYYFSSTTNGTIGMTITPALTTDDYDWAIWGPLASVTCPPSSTPIRCSAADGNGTAANITGLGNGAADVSEGPFGNGWVSSLNVLAGEIYVMVLDNWTASNSPFTLSWQLTNGANLNCVPLPVELISFTGTNDRGKNNIEWITASETNNDFFILQRSRDGIMYEDLITKDAAGNSSANIVYRATDTDPFSDKTYYRLKQIDFDGRSTYSSVISIVSSLAEIVMQNLHPNPASEEFYFDFYTPVEGMIKIELIDLTGRVVLNKTENLSQGMTIINTQISSVAKGIYSLKVEFGDNEFRSIAKIVRN